MERLWTPWRMHYVGGQREPGCVFCNALEADDDINRLIIHRGEHCFVILNLYPYNTGHSMVVPYAHAPNLDELTPEARAEMMELAHIVTNASQRVLRCAGFNIGLNLGDVAGAGVAEHLHMHVVPRWLGDASFMPILGDTVVLPELLPATYAKFRAEIDAMLLRDNPRIEVQAGGLVYLPDRDAIALRQVRTGEIVLPKGKIEARESLAQAAVREVREETGIDAQIIGWSGASSFKHPGKGREGDRVHAIYFLMTGVTTREFASHLNRDTLLVSPKKAAKKLTYADLSELAAAAVPIFTGKTQ